MSKKQKMLERMRANPKGDWTIENVKTLCNQVGLEIAPPRGGGSHYKVHSVHLEGTQTVPKNKPVKVPYIKNLVSLADAHIHVESKKED